MLLSLLEFHLITIQPTSQPGSCGILILIALPFEFLNHWSINSCSNNMANTKQHKNNPIVFVFVFFFSEMKKKTDNKILKRLKNENSPELVMRITSVQLLIKCTKAPSPTTTPFDSCASRVCQNQQNL